MTKNTIRLFVGTQLPAAFQQYLTDYAQILPVHAGKIIPQQTLHLTLLFIGELEQEALPKVLHQLEEIAQNTNSFNLTLSEISSAPNLKPRYIWARFKPEPAFTALATALHNAILPGQQANRQPTPHITLLRGLHIAHAPAPTFPEQRLQLPVDHISLWKSVLASPHPYYRVLHTLPLLANEPY